MECASVEAFAAEWDSSDEYVKAHTSGSTGTPKNIRLLKSDMVLSAEATNRFFGITASSMLYCPLSIDYIAGKMMYVRAAVAGARVVFEKPSLTPLYNFSGRDIDLLAIVPSQIGGLLKSKALPWVRNIIVGGARMLPDDERRLCQAGVTAWETYGMTETCSHVALRGIGRDEYFMALPGFRFAVDERSCLVIVSADMSFKRIVTNDVVELIDSGRFRVKGRFDNVIISGGEKIFPETVELKLVDIMGGLNYYVTSRGSEIWGEVCVLVVESCGVAIDKDRLLQRCREVLPRHHVPKDVVLVERFAYTSSGKIIRAKV